jgi:hypothetical protein
MIRAAAARILVHVAILRIPSDQTLFEKPPVKTFLADQAAPHRWRRDLAAWIGANKNNNITAAAKV